MKKPQLITIITALFFVAIIFLFGRTIPLKSSSKAVNNGQSTTTGNLTDTILNMAKRELRPDQLTRLASLEASISGATSKDQKLEVYHQLAHFWKDSAGFLLPFAFYEGETARLENSENSLTFAARLFLENLQQEQSLDFRRWEALQAKDLFERSLIINPNNDSAKIGLGACYLFGNISAAPMEGIGKIKEVLDRDSTNVYGQMMMVRGSLMSGQYEKAISRLQLVYQLKPNNLEAILLLADTYERINDKSNALKWYERSVPLVTNAEMKTAIEKRIEDLKK
ncbi:MAG: tetratricopeptide repeat protein [Chitinophagales bacterium]